MSRKIFVSYKYADSSVYPLQNYDYFGNLVPTTARHYVDLIQAHLDANDHINKGEDDGEDLSNFKEETIESRLRDKIFDSSITLILISKNMRDPNLPENDQWIPWEISYSLKEMSRNGRTSYANAMLAVVIPDENGSYEYFIEPMGCAHCGGMRWKNNLLFEILGKNMFNRKKPNITNCAAGVCGPLHTGYDHSYIHPVKWSDFVGNVNWYLSIATTLNDNIHDYEIVKMV